jgi:hypothetical protein
VAAWGERGHLTKPNHSQTSNSALNQLLDEVFLSLGLLGNFCFSRSWAVRLATATCVRKVFKNQVFTYVTCDSLWAEVGIVTHKYTVESLLGKHSLKG